MKPERMMGLRDSTTRVSFGCSRRASSCNCYLEGSSSDSLYCKISPSDFLISSNVNLVQGSKKTQSLMIGGWESFHGMYPITAQDGIEGGRSVHHCKGYEYCDWFRRNGKHHLCERGSLGPIKTHRNSFYASEVVALISQLD